MDQFRRREGEPLIERDVRIVAALEHLQESQGRAPGVLDVVPHREWHLAHVSRREIERSCMSIRGKDAHPGLPFDVVLPLVRVRVPVQLADATRLDFDQGGRNRFLCREVAAVGDTDGAVRRFDRLLCHHAVAEDVRDGLRAGYHVLFQVRRRQGDGEDVPFAFLREFSESLDRRLEVFGKQRRGT